MEHKVKYLPLLLFAIYSIKLLVLGASLVDAPILLIMGLISSVYEIKSQSKLLSNLRKDVGDLQKHKEETDKLISEVKTHISGIKLGQNIRGSTLGAR